MSNATVYLVRHGSVENPDDVSYGRGPAPLSEKGRKEMEDLCRLLQARKVVFDVIISSPVVRALQSAEILKDQLGIARLGVREELNDVGIGKLEGAPMQIIRDANYEEEGLAALGFKIEPKRDILQRAAKLIDEVVAGPEGRNVVLVSHGDILRIALWSQEFPERVLSRVLRDEDYLAPGEAVILRFDRGNYVGKEFIRGEGSNQVEKDHIRRTEAY